MKDKLFFSKIGDVKSPERGTTGSAGLDFFIPNDWNNGEKFLLHNQQSVLIPGRIHVKIPENYCLVAMNKSGVATKRNLLKTCQLIDEDYQGELFFGIINSGNHPQYLYPGEKIIQLICIEVNKITPVEIPLEKLYIEHKSERGEGGFGSTGEI